MRSYHPFEIRPAVCPAGDRYEILIPVSAPSLMSVFVNGEEFTNDVNGIKVSSCHVQKFSVPRALLDGAKQYTVVYEIIYREAYCSKKEPPVSRTFRFYPVQNSGDIHIYHLSDVHGRTRAAIKAGGFFGDHLDLLILNGDISSSTQTVKESLAPLTIAYEITKGEKPCIITRGNHDLRGKNAERIGEFYPLADGRFYYTVRVGKLWILVLDCGEDKNDDHREYAGTIAFHKYRKNETAFIRALAENGGVPEDCIKLVVSHIPFMHTDFNPETGVHEFDIEIDTYTEWVGLLNRSIRPHLGLFGHVHKTCVLTGAGRYNNKDFKSPVILGGRPDGNDVYGCGITVHNGGADVVFSNSSKIAEEAAFIPFDH